MQMRTITAWGKVFIEIASSWINSAAYNEMFICYWQCVEHVKAENIVFRFAPGEWMGWNATKQKRALEIS